MQVAVVVNIETVFGPSAKAKWAATAAEARAAIQCAFDQLLQHPDKVHRHDYETRRLGKVQRRGVAIHTVQIGYVSLTIADAPGCQVVMDFDYTDCWPD